ncbi:hypothetical protein VTK73DRAFT_4349 [Phialemonium thermophilum]|uniref:Uncharacterized protein n=1 Tax=Phialemonium thermophilum TaxID=223376 RepID=A0ABR3V9G5_9PEZI
MRTEGRHTYLTGTAPAACSEARMTRSRASSGTSDTSVQSCWCTQTYGVRVRRRAVRTARPKPRRRAGSTKTTRLSGVRRTVRATWFQSPPRPYSASAVSSTRAAPSSSAACPWWPPSPRWYSRKTSCLTFSLYSEKAAAPAGVTLPFLRRALASILSKVSKTTTTRQVMSAGQCRRNEARTEETRSVAGAEGVGEVVMMTVRRSERTSEESPWTGDMASCRLRYLLAFLSPRLLTHDRPRPTTKFCQGEIFLRASTL